MEQTSQLKSLCKKVRRLNLVNLNLIDICNNISLDNECEVDECCICYTKTRLVKLHCGHEFCKHCKRMLEIQENPRCAMCRAPMLGERYKINKLG